MRNSLKKLSNTALALVWVFMLAPVVALADPTVTPDAGFTVGGSNSLVHIIDTLITWVLALTGAIALIVIIYGGITYMLAAGDEKKASKAKNIILYALIGVAVIVGAYFLISLVTSFLTAAK